MPLRLLLAALLVALAPTVARAEVPEILRAAADYDSERTLLELLDADPSLVNYRDPESRWTPLHYAAREAKTENVRLLLDRGADVRIEKEGITPLHFAVQGVSLDVTYEGPDGKPRTVSQEARRKQREDVIRVLLARGADVNAADDRGRGPLAAAAAEGMPRILALLIQEGAAVNPPDLEKSGGNSFPLYHALQRGRFDNAEVLLDHGAEVGAYTRAVRSDPLLSLAVREGTPEFVRRMLVAGADPHHPAAISMAAHYGRLDLVELLESEMQLGKRRQAALDHAIAAAAGARQGEVVEFLRAEGASKAAEERGLTHALRTAIWNGNLDVAKQQVRVGAPVDAYALAALGRLDELERIAGSDPKALEFRETMRHATLLHAAAACGQLETAAWLLGRKADPDAATRGGYTPLHRAALCGRERVVGLLLDHGADVHAALGNLYVHGKYTSLDLAVSQGHRAAIVRLLRAGARLEHEFPAFAKLLLAGDATQRRELVTLLAKPVERPRIEDLAAWARSAGNERTLTALREAGVLAD